ncbi:MAG: ABC transporter ATP-binding protein [Bacteroidota bacterium]|nr:ABC transporter ATP-binding protein [Bacteroidota bacterium]
MSKIVLKAHNISKQYRLGQLGTGTVSHDLNRWWYKLRGKEDPYLKVGDTNDRSKMGGSDYVWSLKDINFEVEQGEVLGIIGKNGAGKSTLLKILSQVTTPTTGEVKIKGRVASLLEVGTGFHPELTGRENIYLNGAILGMTKIEIKRKLDEIVEFSGVAKYIDTPVKRYSSGMMVRLGFAVAAHLEPEILIVDEVLAVGDQEFQDKCIGKMKDVSSQGRTVLFVSHNMGAVQNLCNTCMYLKNGQIEGRGTTKSIIESYLNENRNVQLTGIIPPDFYRLYTNGEAFFRKILITDLEGNVIDRLAFNQSFKVVVELEAMQDLKNVMININIGTTLGQPILYAVEKDNSSYVGRNISKGSHTVEAVFNVRLLPGKYSFTLGVNYLANGNTIDWVENVYFISVDKIGYNKNEVYPWDDVHGFVEPDSKWSFK